MQSIQLRHGAGTLRTHRRCRARRWVRPKAHSSAAGATACEGRTRESDAWAAQTWMGAVLTEDMGDGGTNPEALLRRA